VRALRLTRAWEAAQLKMEMKTKGREKKGRECAGRGAEMQCCVRMWACQKEKKAAECQAAGKKRSSSSSSSSGSSSSNGGVRQTLEAAAATGAPWLGASKQASKLASKQAGWQASSAGARGARPIGAAVPDASLRSRVILPARPQEHPSCRQLG
jgi:hypothetical protein